MRFSLYSPVSRFSFVVMILTPARCALGLIASVVTVRTSLFVVCSKYSLIPLSRGERAGSARVSCLWDVVAGRVGGVLL